MKIAFNHEKQEEAMALKNRGVLATAAESDLIDFTLIASVACQAPIAFIAIEKESSPLFRAKFGLSFSETTSNCIFCTHVIRQNDFFTINNLSEDSRFPEISLKVGAGKVQFYAGAPIRTHAGTRIGTLCVMDITPRELHANQKDALIALSKKIADQIELKIQLCDLQTATATSEASLNSLSLSVDSPSQQEISSTKKIDAQFLDLKEFKSNFAGMNDFALHIIETFFNSLPKMISEVDKAISSNRLGDLEISAHSLKGAVSNFYAEECKHLAWRLEQIGKGQNIEPAPKIFVDLKIELNRLRTALENFREELRHE